MGDEFREQVARLRQWVLTIPENEREGAWDSAAYAEWDAVYRAFEALVSSGRSGEWPRALMDDVLFALALDADVGGLIRRLRETDLDALLLVAEQAEQRGRADAQWQCADALGRSCPLERAEPVLLRLVQAADEYVRRVALQALAHLGSSSAEAIALTRWREADPSPWTRMSALSALFELRSPHLDALLGEAERSSDDDLAAHAKRLREMASP